MRDSIRRRANRVALPTVAVIALCSVACAHKPDAPAIQLTDVGFVLHVPPAMQQALDAAAPGFQSVRTTSFRSDVSQAAVTGGGGLPALSATVGDFDHDGTVDAAVEGTVSGDSALHVFVILNGAKPKAVEVATVTSYDADAVGTYLTGVSGGATGAFEMVSYPDSSTVFQYQDGGFVGSKIGS